jgi:hypothetical protein
VCSRVAAWLPGPPTEGTPRDADLGSHRKISRFRLLRPVLRAIIIVPIFLDKIATHGGGLGLELAGAAVGLAGGLIALALMKVYRSDTS